MLNHILLFIITVSIGVIGAILGLSYWLVIAIIIGLTIISVSYFLYIMFWSQNLRAIEKVLYNNKKDPNFAYLIAVKENEPEVAITHLETLIHKVKTPSQKHQYEIIRAILAEDYHSARKHAEEIAQSEVGKYSLALLDAMEGNGEQHLNSIYTKPWMSSAIRAAHYFKIGDFNQYEIHRDLAISLSRGLQYAATIYTFRNAENQADVHTIHNETAAFHQS